MLPKWSLKHARPDGSQGRPDGPSFSCLKSNSGIFCRAVRMSKYFRPDAYSGHPDSQLQPPFQNSTESSHNKAMSGRCCPSIRTVALWLHVITIIRLWSVQTLKGDVWTVELCMHILPYGEHRPDGITHRPDGSSRLPITVS
jgi:hypothetical protein